MNFVVPVRESKRNLLGAVTHVDGTARLQTVSRNINQAYWEVITAFRKRTGVPILLNTSFNNNVEPIVDSVADAVTTFLTTDLDGLVVGSYLIKKRTASPEDWSRLALSLPPYSSLHQVRAFTALDRQETVCEIRTGPSSREAVRISSELFELLMRIDGEAPLGDILDLIAPNQNQREALLNELRGLWEQRSVRLHPMRAGSAAEPLSSSINLSSGARL